MKILQIDSSPRSGGHSRALSAAIVERLREILTDTHVTYRDLGAAPLPPVDAAYAHVLAGAIASGADPGGGSMALSETLIQELETADILVIGTPIHNFTVPSSLKAWIDHVVRLNRTMSLGQTGKIGLLPDRPVFIGIAAGGFFFGPEARQPDCIMPYLSAVLGCIGLQTLHFLPVQATAFRDDTEIASARSALVDAIGHDHLVRRA